MPTDELYKDLLYRYEILYSRLDVRNFYLHTAIRDAYDNIGQMLSLARVEVAMLQSAGSEDNEDRLHHTGKLVGKAIAEIKDMCRMLNPEKEFIELGGVGGVVQAILKQMCPEVRMDLETQVVLGNKFNNERGFVLFGVLMELQHLTAAQKNAVHLVAVTCKENRLNIEIDYTAVTPLELRSEETNEQRLPIEDRVRMLNGRLETGEKDPTIRYIRLTMPMN